jgi:hypothetical protein
LNLMPYYGDAWNTSANTYTYPVDTDGTLIKN